MTGVGDQPRDFVEFVRDTRLRLVALERRQTGNATNIGGTVEAGEGIIITGSGTAVDPYVLGVYKGTTAERDAIFGVPANLAQQVALANQKIVWFNETWGWEESYYVATGSAGLTAPGLITGTASGWYPTGVGPMAQLVPNATQAMSTGTWFQNWAAFGTGESRRRGGSTWWGVTVGSLVPKFAGFYRPFGMLLCQTGAGSGSLALLKNGSGAANDTLVIQRFDLSSGFNTPIVMPSSDLPLRANEGIGIYASSVGSATFAVGANGASRAPGNLSLAYIGPPLASD